MKNILSLYINFSSGILNFTIHFSHVYIFIFKFFISPKCLDIIKLYSLFSLFNALIPSKVKQIFYIFCSTHF